VRSLAIISVVQGQERLRSGAPLATPDQATFYAGDAQGYIDYPAL
jgi:N-ethylmaleimide reductase